MLALLGGVLWVWSATGDGVVRSVETSGSERDSQQKLEQNQHQPNGSSNRSAAENGVGSKSERVVNTPVDSHQDGESSRDLTPERVEIDVHEGFLLALETRPEELKAEELFLFSELNPSAQPVEPDAVLLGLVEVYTSKLSMESLQIAQAANAELLTRVRDGRLNPMSGLGQARPPIDPNDRAIHIDSSGRRYECDISRFPLIIERRQVGARRAQEFGLAVADWFAASGLITLQQKAELDHGVLSTYSTALGRR
jgi:hypothetical protein